ncbi:MAG: VIT domain-containing protein, partial [Planctomycetota bacterium]
MLPRKFTLAALAPLAPLAPLASLALALGLTATPGNALQRGAFAGSSVSHVIVPQTRGFAWQPGRQAVVIEAVKVRVSILEQAASTTLDILLRNPGSRRAEAVLLLPVPDGAAVGAFTFQGAASEPSARVLSAAEARRTYDEIVRKL